MGWLLPVGVPGGINSGFDGIDAGSGIVRLGDKLAGIELGHYRLWRAAAAAPQAEQLIAWGAAQGIPDAAERVRQLEEAELLIADGPGVEQRIGRLALRLLGECLGNGADSSLAFVVLGRGKTQLQVEASLFEVLLNSDGVRPISVTCNALDASQSRRRPCIESLAEGLPALVRNEVVLLGEAVR
jgi:hypothetical protein